jgi:hypothetical protein
VSGKKSLKRADQRAAMVPPDMSWSKYMREAIAEFLVVVEHSRRTQIALVLAVLFFVGLQLAGLVFVGQFELHGILAPMTDIVRDRLMHRYDKAAWFALGGFLLTAVKCYRKDRRRLFEL